MMTPDDLRQALELMGFDASGTEQLFCDITGNPRDAVTFDAFAEYFTRLRRGSDLCAEERGG